MGSEADLIPVGNFLSVFVGNLANILGARYTPKKIASALRITVALGTAARFGYTVSDGNATTPLLYLEDGVTLTANHAHTWVIGARRAYSYQFQADQPSEQMVKIQYLTIEEVPAGEI